jgi:hypothetical protein
MAANLAVALTARSAPRPRPTPLACSNLSRRPRELAAAAIFGSSFLGVAGSAASDLSPLACEGAVESEKATEGRVRVAPDFERIARGEGGRGENGRLLLLLLLLR